MPTAFVSTVRCRVRNLLIHTESLILVLRVLLLATDRIAGSDEKNKKKKKGSMFFKYFIISKNAGSREDLQMSTG